VASERDTAVKRLIPCRSERRRPPPFIGGLRPRSARSADSAPQRANLSFSPLPQGAGAARQKGGPTPARAAPSAAPCAGAPARQGPARGRSPRPACKGRSRGRSGRPSPGRARDPKGGAATPASGAGAREPSTRAQRAHGDGQGRPPAREAAARAGRPQDRERRGGPGKRPELGGGARQPTGKRPAGRLPQKGRGAGRAAKPPHLAP